MVVSKTPFRYVLEKLVNTDKSRQNGSSPAFIYTDDFVVSLPRDCTAPTSHNDWVKVFIH